MDIIGKKCIVTGVSKGIGRATVLSLLDRGALVAGWGRNKPDIDDPHFSFFKTDIRNIEEVEAAYAATVTKLGEDVSILINNSGLGYFGKIDEMSIERWHEMYDTNVNGLYYCTRAVLANMKKLRSGHIINIASIAGLMGIEEAAAYCGTKFAVRGLSHSLFKELRRFGIKITCIYPGSVNTNFFDSIASVSANDQMLAPTDIAQAIINCLEASDNCHVIDVELRPFVMKSSM